MKISAVIIAGNEEKKIGDAVSSVSWADETLVIDSESTDRTREIAEGLGARVITRPWPGFSAQKQFGVDAAAFDWICSLDADERVSPALADAIAAVRSRPEDTLPAGYRPSRLTFYMGRPIRHSGWYPDRQTRLFDRRRGHWKNVLVHESVQIDEGARVENIEGDIIHYTVDTAREHNNMIGDRYAPLAARQALEAGMTTSLAKVVLAGPSAFLRSYLLKAGFLDGFPGFCLARFAAHHAFMKQLCLWELLKEKR